MLLYGFGVTAYFKLLVSLTIVFLILSLKAAAIMSIYHQFDVLTDLSNTSPMGKLVYSFSMSKMPHARAKCLQ